MGATDLSDEAIGVLCRDGDLLACGIAALRATPASRWSAAGRDVVAARCSAALESRPACAVRANGDPSIDLPKGCSCELCGELRAFLQDPTQTKPEWPVAKGAGATCTVGSTPPGSLSIIRPDGSDGRTR